MNLLHRCEFLDLKITFLKLVRINRFKDCVLPADPPPGFAIVKLNERIGISVGHLVENDQNAINVGQRLDVVHGQHCKSYSQKKLTKQI